MILASLLVFLLIPHKAFCDDTGKEGDAYQQINEGIGNVAAWGISLIKPSFWGAFSYGASKVASETMLACGVCVRNNEDPNVKCQQALEWAARTIALSAFGGHAYNNGALKREGDPSYDWYHAVEKLLDGDSIRASLSDFISFVWERIHLVPSFVLYNSKLDSILNVSLHEGAGGVGVVSASHPKSNSTLTKREQM